MNEAGDFPPFDLQYEEAIVEFDQARRRNLSLDVEGVIARVSDSQQPRLVAEIACVDLEYAFEQGVDVALSPFLALFPAIFQRRELREEVAKEHYRLCCVSGKPATREEIAARYDLDTQDWEELPTVAEASATAGHQDVAFPCVGATFCGYPLIAELGRGALARVYIARQPDLAQRWVVLKVTRQATAEAEQLAYLQHSGVIPVYSIHRDKELYGICMPYLGAVTLGDLLADGRIFRQGGVRQEIVSTFVAERASTIVSTVHAPVILEGCANDRKKSGQNSVRQVSESIDRDAFEKLLGLDDLAASLQKQFLHQDSLAAKVQFIRQLAEAVGYAHSRGVVHRDLKPENVLVANDGKPVVLDFNLAIRENDRTDALFVGGTLPYMSPQQLRSLDSGGRATPQDDVFSLGVILYQLLSGTLPYEVTQGSSLDLEAIAKRREESAPEILNSGIPPSLNAILTKCLMPVEAERYDNASSLSDDLLRFEFHQVLKYAADRSPVERVQKWIKRHPTLTSTASIVAVSMVAILGFATAFFVSQQRADRLDASHQVSQLHADLPETLAMLRSPGGEPELIHQGLEDGMLILHAWGVDRVGLEKNSTWNRLSQPTQHDVAQQLGDLLYSMAGSKAHLALIDAQNRASLLGGARGLNERAAQVCPELNSAVRLREAKIDSLLNPTSAELNSDALKFLPNANSLFAQMLIARESGRTEQWLQLADQLVAEQPVDPTRWFTLASARFATGDFASASDAFDVAAKLQKQSAVPIFWRGVARLKAGEAAQAKEDFSACIKLRNEWVAPRYNRALASRSTGAILDAIHDLDWIAEAGNAGPRVFSLRSQLWSAMGDSAKSAADRTLALEATPLEADDWVSQGVLKIAEHPQEALSDFANALRIAPQNVAAQMNTAHVQAEILRDNNAAIDTLTRLVDAGLGGTSAIASRGILRARSGAKPKALEDAELAAKSSPSPLEMLQIAGIYAICHQESNQDMALRWLAQSLAGAPGLRRLAATDPDLANLRGRAGFRALVLGELPADENE